MPERKGKRQKEMREGESWRKEVKREGESEEEPGNY